MPRPLRFPALPQNEHVTMRLATLVSIETPPLGVFQLKDGSLGTIVRRFDRLDDGTTDALPSATAPIERSFLPAAMQEQYLQILRENTATLAG